MNEKAIYETLERFGLSYKEIKVYLYGLSVGPQNVSHIAKGSGISRTNGYDVVRRLSSLGLCKNLGSEYGKKIMMLPPDGLARLLDQKRKDIDDLEKDLDTTKKYLSKITKRNIQSMPRISYVEGVDGVRQLFEEILRTNTKTLRKVIGDHNIMNVLGKSYTQDWIDRRISREIEARVLHPVSFKDRNKVKKTQESELRTVRYLPKEISHETSLLLFDDTVVEFTTQGPLYGVMTKSVTIAEDRRGWFDYLWNN